MKCQHSNCKADITYAVNLKTLKNVPLVPFDEKYPKAVRYSLRPKRSDGQQECERCDSGAYMNHFANCVGASKFSGRNKK